MVKLLRVSLYILLLIFTITPLVIGQVEFDADNDGIFDADYKVNIDNISGPLDDVEITYSGTNYTEDDATLAGHLGGIDNRLIGISHTAHGSVSTATELSPGSHSLTVSGAFNLTFGDLVETTAYEQSIILRVIGNATHSITWPATVLWSFGVAPTQPFPATLHTIVFKTVDGETIEGYEVGLEMQTVP